MTEHKLADNIKYFILSETFSKTKIIAALWNLLGDFILATTKDEKRIVKMFEYALNTIIEEARKKEEK